MGTTLTSCVLIVLAREVLLIWLTLIAFSGLARARRKKFRLLLTCAITFSSFIRVMLEELSWKEIPLSRSWPRDIKLKSYSIASATFCKLIVPFLRGIDTVTTCSVRMSWPIAITKSMHIGCKSLNKDLLLHRYREAQESRYHVSEAFCISFDDFATIITFATGPGVNGSGFELLSATTWCALFWHLVSGLLLLLF